jgi:hypothetical protein
MSRLLLELAPGHGQHVLARIHLALQHGPVIRVLAREIRTPRVAEQHLEATHPLAPQQDAGAGAARLVDPRLSDARHLWVAGPRRAQALDLARALTIARTVSRATTATT